MPKTEIEPPLTKTNYAISSLRNNFAWTLGKNVFYGACKRSILYVLAKMGNTSIVGQPTLGLAIFVPVFTFTNLQLRTVQATDVNVESRFTDYFTSRLLATLVGLIVVIVLLPWFALCEQGEIGNI
jgi:hypothetical protein